MSRQVKIINFIFKNPHFETKFALEMAKMMDDKLETPVT